MSPPLEVLFFLTELGGGGAESHLLRILNHLDRKRVKPSLAVCRRGGSYEQFLRADVPIHTVSVERIPSRLGRLMSAAPGLTRLVRETRPDAVASIMDTPNIVSIGALSLLRSRPRVVAIVQIPPSIEYARTPFGRRVVLPGIRALYHRADRVISLSHGVKRDLASIDRRIVDRTTVIHNACVDERIADADSETYEGVPEVDRPVILAVGRLVHQKGYPYLLEAFAAVRARVDAEMWILGDGPDRAALERRATELGVADHIRFLGFRSNPQAFMRRATVFVLSSLFEGFGNVVVEALGCGTPVVSTDCPHGPGEVIKDGESGLLVPVADAGALGDALIRALEDEPLRKRLSAAGKVRAQDFSASVIAAEYASELERVCDRAPRVADDDAGYG